MKSFLFLIFLQISRAMMDNLEDLRIIDALLQEYDRRATPTNKMGRLGILKNLQISQIKLARLNNKLWWLLAIHSLSCQPSIMDEQYKQTTWAGFTFYGLVGFDLIFKSWEWVCHCFYWFWIFSALKSQEFRIDTNLIEPLIMLEKQPW